MTTPSKSESSSKADSSTPSQSTGSPQHHRSQSKPQEGVVLGMQTVTGIADDLKQAHEARVTVDGAPGVDARLDNRHGADRPPLETFPAKPQQIDGPDVRDQVEHTRRVLADRNRRDSVDRKGMFSPGQHGLADESVREGNAKTDSAKTGTGR